MRVFIVHAHHEPQSFNGAMTREAVAALTERGDEVMVSDLYAMGFDPVSGRRNFTTVADPTYLKQQAEEAHAVLNDGFAQDLRDEMDKLFWCDALILQFPLWWFGMPAILKGWVDRVFASGGQIYGGGKWYDRGVFVGKRAMCALTIGGPPEMYAADGLNGPIEQILFPINHGMLAFTGFTVVQPFLVHAPARISPQARRAGLADYRTRVLGILDAPTIAYPKLENYDEAYRLKPGTPVDSAE
jgi:NAD(P)H dehydrogenase (quinone)